MADYFSKTNKGAIKAHKMSTIDKQSFESLCALQCTQNEIAFFFRCSYRCIEEWVKETYKHDDGTPMTFKEVFKILRSGGMISLRRKQFKLADKSAPMAIWLGRQILGQTENRDEVDQEGIKIQIVSKRSQAEEERWDEHTDTATSVEIDKEIEQLESDPWGDIEETNDPWGEAGF